MNRRMLGAVIGIIAVALIAVIVVFAIRQSAPEQPPTQDSSQQAAPSTNPSDIETGTDAAEVSEVKVAINNFAFQPATLTVKPGTKVTWTNNDEVSHTVTVDDESQNGPKSELFGKGESYSFTFNTVGEFPYHCLPHPHMKGTVKVVE